MRCEHGGLNVVSFFYLFHTKCVYMEIIQPYSKLQPKTTSNPFLSRLWSWSIFNVLHPTVSMNLDHDGMAGPVKSSLSSGIATKGHKTFLLSFQPHENTYEMFKNHIKYHIVILDKCCNGRSVKIWFSCETLIIKKQCFYYRKRVYPKTEAQL